MDIVKSQDIAFFRALNFEGDSIYFPVGETVTLRNSVDNDAYLSLKVISNVEVHCWQNFDESGVYKIYTQGEYPSIKEIKGLSKFSVRCVSATR